MNKTIALLSNVTIESLALRIEKEAEDSKVLTPSGFDAWRTELLNSSSVVLGNDVTTIYVLLHGPALFPSGVDARFAETLAEPLNILCQTRNQHKDKIFVVSTLDLPSSPTLLLTGKNFPTQAAAYWRNELEKMDIPILDLSELVTETGRERFYSAKTWYFASLPFSRQGELLLVREILRFENALRRSRKKCLVLDLDNTLWGGVISEDGLEGISLSPFGVGAPHRDLQRIAKELSEQGILLAIASKNDAEDALLPLREHPHMLLREKDFVKIKVDWSPKSDNIAAIARELNLGLDSLVFIDDNPMEREAVKAVLPEVMVPEFPKDTSQLPTFMAKVARTYFTALRVGDEDREKTEMYRADSRREEERKTRLSLDDYLVSLDMELDLHRLRENEISRAAQLTQKTNQFNLTTRRYTEADMTAMLNDDRVRVWMAGLRDRFGDYGRICLVIARVNASQAVTTAIIDTFLMSCRVIGRGVEEAVLWGVERALADEGVAMVRGEYRTTAKNEPVRDFWDKMGYMREAPKEGVLAEDASHVWVLRSPFPERRTQICLNS
ncbi:MAG: HAD-IIIC family phosphatase [Synergistaceae bacterium]|jgi:FkbH-like protein|nr:HAD-IIIC family phosphatase [Synergistaceae bacterium]